MAQYRHAAGGRNAPLRKSHRPATSPAVANARRHRYTLPVQSRLLRKTGLSVLVWLLALGVAGPVPAQRAGTPLPEAEALTAKARTDYVTSVREFARLLAEDVAHDTADPAAAAHAEYCALMLLVLQDDSADAEAMRAVTAARKAPLAQLHPALRGRLGALLLEARRRHGGELEPLARELGVIRSLWICGPFANERGAGYQTEHLPEVHFDASEVYDGKLRPVSWRRLPAELAAGQLWLGNVLRPNTQCLAYVATAVIAEQDQTAVLALGSTGAVKVFCNGIEVFARDVERQMHHDQDTVALPLRAGHNLLVVKACHQEGADFGVCLRLCRHDGGPLDGVRCSTEPDDMTAAGEVAPRELAEAPAIDDNARSYYTAAAAEGDAIAAMRLCAMLTHAHVDGDLDPRPKRLAEQAAAGLPDCAEAAFLRFWTRPQLVKSGTDRDDNPQRRDLAEVLRRDPQHAEAMLLLGWREMYGSNLPQRAEQLARQALAVRPDSPAVALMWSIALQRQGLGALGDRAIETVADLPAVGDNALRHLLRVRLENDEIRAAAVTAERILVQSTWTADLLAAARLWLRLGQRDRGVALLRDAIALWPLVRDQRAVLADLLAAEGDREGALHVWTDWLQICPEDDQALLSVAALHAQRGDRERQTEVLRAAVELNPNLTSEQRYLEYLTRDQAPFYRPFELDGDAEIAADPGPPADAAASGDPLHHLLRQRVIKAFANGTTSEYLHLITRVLSEEGARRFQNWRLPYYYGAQRGRLLSCTVRHPDGSVEHPELRGPTVAIRSLQPGDIVEIEGRIDDLAPTFFGNYFGLQHVFASPDGSPLRRSLLTVIATPGRDYRCQAANGAPEPTRELLPAGDTRYDWELRDLGRDEPEVARPGAQERLPLMRMTTYRDWNQFASWWWHLIEKQIDVSPAMRAKVRELCADARTPAERVDRIYRFVTTDVRYEAWEFGVHGYKPYNTSVIFERRHGDCKDKALLLCALLREAAIVARPVLIFADPRRSEDDLSLALVDHFNHCIAWLPAQDGLEARFLDGTANLHPSDTLPEMDQGALVLVVEPDGGALQRVPWTTPERNVDAEQFTVALRADGSADVELVQQPLGNAAVSLRRELTDAPATLREQLERRLLHRFGKCRIERVEPSDGTDLLQPARLALRFTASEFARRQGDQLQLQGGFDSRGLQALCATPERTAPLLLGVPHREQQVLRIQLPPGMRVGQLPPPTHIEQPFGAFALEWRQQGDHVVVERDLRLSAPRIAPADYAAFRAFTAAVQDADGARLVIAPEENR